MVGKPLVSILLATGFRKALIAVKEILPIMLVCIIWGNMWKHQSVLAHCDNQSVVDVINSGYNKDAELISLLCNLLFITANLQISLRVALQVE